MKKIAFPLYALFLAVASPCLAQFELPGGTGATEVLPSQDSGVMGNRLADPGNENDRSWSGFVNLDYLGVGSAAKGAQSVANAACQGVIALGAASCADSLTVNGAFGARVGVLHDYNGLQIGASAGYLYGGPQGSGKLNLASAGGSVGTGSASQDATDNTFRVLGQVRKVFPLSGSWSAQLGGGIGVAVDDQSYTCSASGGLACNSSGSSTTMGWMTWEISPAVAYKQYSLGARYVGFARGGYTPWNTFGAYLGLDF
ncbi:MAG: hypothetical protein HKL90_14995 [Elusimicrobia bacterium]|nr:hypothetical protein [Elusimicrobiota bacterium]